ncbi:hypothetical protein [Streptomyces tropicalis]|uniref:Uncharacterized protein n=1 Tax=Streptomyces tropicalis TaxID=3034234 RepID=A0ABT6A2K1_9ACTN|nr:hypothetical protein [Streptomyces tropicalis]MDF3298864.1 hypothetical protein [Streptomyces tropicalis]
MSDDLTPSTHTQLLGAYWLDSPYLHRDSCCCFEHPRPRVRAGRVARAALTVLAYAAIVTALAVTAGT